MKRIRYFDHAATTAVNREVVREMFPYFSTEYGNPSSVYQIGRRNRRAIENVRNKMAKLLNCKANELYFTSCGSESDNLAIKGIMYANRKRGNHMITSKIEHPAVLNTCKFLEKQGFEVTYLDVDKLGRVDIKDLISAIKSNTVLISIMMANNEIGTIEPIREIAQVAKDYNLIFHTDAVQAAGNIKIDVEDMNVSALSISAHKFYGPKGVGLLYIKEGVDFVEIQNGGHQENSKRAGTENVPGIIGMGKAFEIANWNLEIKSNNLKNLRNYFLSQVKQRIPDCIVNGDLEKRLPGNASVSFKGIDASDLVLALDEYGICTSAGSACTSGSVEPSHVLLAIGLSEEYIKGTLRASFGLDNNIDDVNFFIDRLEEIVAKLRKI